MGDHVDFGAVHQCQVLFVNAYDDIVVDGYQMIASLGIFQKVQGIHKAIAAAFFDAKAKIPALGLLNLSSDVRMSAL